MYQMKQEARKWPSVMVQTGVDSQIEQLFHDPACFS
jgi:hypothetical protein